MNEKEVMEQVFSLTSAGNKKEALVVLRQAAEAGVTEAYGHLAEHIVYDDPSAYAEAIMYAQKAAAAKDSIGYTILGVCHMDGKGTPVDPVKARENFEIASEMGNPKAPRYLGILYEEGIGVEKDLNKAFEYYHLAADRGDTKAQFQTGRFYENGIAVEADMEKAVEWYRKSAQRGGRLAKPAMDALERLGR